MAEFHRYTDARVTFGGVEFPNTQVTIEAVEPKKPEPPTILTGRSYQASVETTITREAFDRFMAALRAPERGASTGTLARRVLYGGRKGRSAARRLWARGYTGVVIVDGVIMLQR